MPQVREQGPRKRYTPLLAREDALRQEAKNTLSRIKTGGLGLLISTMARESELSDEDGRPLREEDWVNAFTSFRMDVACPECGETTESIIDIETA